VFNRRPISVAQAFQLNQLLRQGSLLLVAVAIANSKLLLSEIGRYENFLYVQYALTFFWITGLIQGLLSVHPTLPAEKQSAMLTTAYLALCVPAGLLSLFLMVSGNWVFDGLIGTAPLPNTDLFLVVLALAGPSLLLDYVYLLKKQVHWIIGLALANALLLLGGIALVLWTDLGIRAIWWVQLLLSLVRHILLIRVLFFSGKSGVFPDWQLGRSWVRLSLPLMAYTLLGGFMPTLTGWLVNWQHAGDPELFALFRYGARELPLTLALSEALSASIIPVLSANGAAGLAELKAQSTRLMHMVFPLTILLMATASRWFLPLFGTDFEQSIPVLCGYFLITSSRTIFSKSILVAKQENAVLLGMAFIELVLLMGVGGWLSAHYGISGLALGVAVAYLAEKILHAAFLYHRYAIRPSDYLSVGWWSVYSLLLLLVYGLM